MLASMLAGTAGGEVVLLHNGSLLNGDVRRTAEEILIENDGSTIRLRPAEVAHVADSALAAYEWRRSGASDGLAERLGLAEWAIRNRLFPQAARELLNARQIAPRSRRLALLERRLDELMRQPAPTVASISEPTEPVAIVAEVTATPAEEPLPNLPPGSLEQFTRRIQPLLVNSCGTSGCHGGGKTDVFPLDPSWRHGYGDARSTQQNLRTTLAAIDFGSPAASVLLAAAEGPHAGVMPITGSRRDEMLDRLSAWATRVAMMNAEELAPPPMARAIVAAPAADVVRAIDPGRHIDYGVVTASFEAPATPKRGLQSVRVGPRDAFDPEIFNRKHRRPQDDLPADGR